MEAPESGRSVREGWTIQSAEGLLKSLPGVLSVRVVGRPGGLIEEIHLLTTQEVTAKQTVRNVESALMAEYKLEVDHRKISVAQADREKVAEREIPLLLHQPQETPETRILFVGHTVESERSHRVRVRVAVEWKGERYAGEASGADLPRSRLEALGSATLNAIEKAVGAKDDDGPEVALSLDGVKVVDAFDRRFILSAVHALYGRDITALAGAAAVEDSMDRSVIMATLQATDRWIRGRA